MQQKSSPPTGNVKFPTADPLRWIGVAEMVGIQVVLAASGLFAPPNVDDDDLTGPTDTEYRRL